MMHLRKTQVVVLLLALAACRFAGAVQRVHARVHLSDGSTVQGTAYIPSDRFYLYSESEERRYTIAIGEVRKIENIIERQSMEEKWLFRESGLDDKVRTGRRYPVRTYRTRVTFHDGRVLSGHLIARTLYVDAGGEKHRFTLRHKQEGRVGQTLSDLDYVRSVEFSEEGRGAVGTIEGRLQVPEGEVLAKILAVNRDKLLSVNVPFNATSGRFRAEGCTEGTYDLVAVTDRAIYLYFSREREEEARRLNTADVRAVQGWIDQLRDFFHSQRILYGAGTGKDALVLVLSERRGGTTLAGLQLLRRYDVWAMHRPKEQWQIRRRLYLWRTASRDLDLEPLQAVITPALGGHTVSAEKRDLEVNAELTRNDRVAIPPPEREKEGGGEASSDGN
jgi:hypothetical protein